MDPVNRSGSNYSAPRDANRVPLLMAASTADGITPVVLEADPVTHLLQVSSSGGGGGGTQYTDGGIAVTHPTGNSLIYFNGSNIPTAVTTANPLPITGTISVGSTTDNSAFTAGTSTTGPIAGVFNDGLTALSSGFQGTLRSTANRGLHTNLRNASGTEIGTSSNPVQVSLANTATNSTAVKVDGSGVTQPISGTVTANAGTNLNTSALATSANQTNNSQTTQIVNSSGNPITSTNVNGTTQSLNVFVENAAAGSLLGRVNLYDSTNTNAAAVDSSGSLLVKQATASNLNMTEANSATIATNTGNSATSANQTNGNQQVQGNIASGSSDSGNPVKVGGRYNATLPTLTDGQRGDIQLTSRGYIGTTLFMNNSATTVAGLAQNADGVATSSTINTLAVSNYARVFNGTTWDRQYGDATKGTWVNVKNTVALPAGTNLIGKVGIDQTTPGTTNGVSVTNTSLAAVGTTASGSSLTSNPVTVGGLAKTALPTAVSDGQVVNAMGDKFGRQVVIPGTFRDLVGTQTTTISSSTSETTIVTAVASTFLDLTALVISNTSATATRIDFRDTTAGSILFSLYIPAGDVRGVAFQRPVPQTSVNTNWTAQCGTSVADIRVYAVFDKNK